MKWKSGHETTERGYKFTYDSLNRLTAATYGEGTGFTTNPNRFNENITYNDKMGNIKTLQRRGKISENGYDLMDNLTYSYTGNQLTKVTDAVTTPIAYQAAFHFVDRANTSIEYEYNKNGNLKKDLNRNITSITYNELNLPSVITFSDNKSITYGYDAAGSKLSVAYLSDGVTSRMDYVGNKVYNNGTLSTLLTEEGYIEPGTTPTYHYYLKDHQGNNRVVISQTGTVEEVNHYYPFGGLFGEGLQNSNQRYKYNGKEFDHKYDLDMYDYGARHYDPALGRWFTVDPLAEKYYSISSYAYVANNPVRFIDPDGRDIKIFFTDEKGRSMSWIFNGSNQDRAPKNQFVSDFIMAYDYNMQNGGGDKLQEAAKATDYTLNLVRREEGHSRFRTTLKGRASVEGTVYWNPAEGLETPKGTLSPATILEHEMDHGVQWQTNTPQFTDDRSLSDTHFKDKEEKRVITGSEYKTGVANGELKAVPKGKLLDSSSYRGHSGISKNNFVPVISPISNKKRQ